MNDENLVRPLGWGVTERIDCSEPDPRYVRLDALASNDALLNYILDNEEVRQKIKDRIENPHPHRRTEKDAAEQQEILECSFANILKALGIDDRDGTKNTPKRVAKFYIQEFTVGLHADPADILGVTFNVEHSELVAVHNIPFYSLCEHHLVPFFGKCHVGYIPKTKVVGLSKIARLVDVLARRPNVQERLTQDIAKAIENVLDVQGVMVIMTAEHLCMTMRGIRVPGTLTSTSVAKGLFRNVEAARAEFMKIVEMNIR